ncbi:hypothetical protein NM688_g2871 [Phlebia brevispora]|uniref:Uncharacterized protein n=1 Tax=Phlebia brevispora TaxID=194682 RepID=A0ACC1T7J8_9APHY|nr:hypothetical protein NM688_g2871 [Phlebia brevispora]
MKFTALTAALLGLASLASAAPTATPEKRDVYSPPVLYPHAGTVWYSGQTHNVTWDNSNPPQNISNRAIIELRWNNQGLPIVLAHDFDLRAGRVEVQVPEVVTSDVFGITLFGDGGNWSQNFTIIGPIGPF